MGIFIAFIAHIFFTYALSTAKNKYITVFMNLAPGITLFLFWIIFNNAIKLQTALGIAIIMASILSMKLPKKEKIISED
jgi:drug/metabolite transporter (DMT)-like permease